MLMIQCEMSWGESKTVDFLFIKTCFVQLLYNFLLFFSVSIFISLCSRACPELALPDLVTKFTTPAKQSSSKNSSDNDAAADIAPATDDMEIYTAQMATALMSNGSILHSSTSSSSSTSRSSANVSRTYAKQQQQTSTTAFNNGQHLTAQSGRLFEKQKSVSYVTNAMSTLALQPNTGATHTILSASASSLPACPSASSNGADKSSATALMPPPPLPPASTGHQQRQSTKMTKKELKLAQAQLDKLHQINIHLQGRIFIIYHFQLWGLGGCVTNHQTEPSRQTN